MPSKKKLPTASIVIALLLLVAACYALRLAYADYLFRAARPDTMERAAALVPLHAEYQARVSHLERAVRLNPYFSAAWIELGLQEEAASDFKKAEAALREAARVDKTFEPRWTLANYYFRRDNADEFWKWIRAAAEMSYGDRTALFQLCWRASQDPEVIFSRGIPPQSPVLGDYLDYLANARQFEAAEVVAARLLLMAPRAEVPRLLAFCERLLESGRRPDGAVRLWNGMIGRGWLPYAPLDPDAGRSLTNGDFRVSPLARGFDWRLLFRVGAHAAWIDSPGGLLITLDGWQDERTDIVEQWLPLRSSLTYELSVRAQSNDISWDSGLHWMVLDPTSGENLTGTGLNALGGTLTFTTPPRCKLAKLILRYQRLPGATRIEGRLRLSSVTLLRKRDPDP